jgi:predicted nucleic-acid-binding protein
VINYADKNSIQILLLSEVIIETVWVLESNYRCTREEISQFLEALIYTPTFTFSDYQSVRLSVYQYQKGGDFADLLIVNQAIEHHATKLFSFDKKLQNKFPGFVVDKLSRIDL